MIPASWGAAGRVAQLFAAARGLTVRFTDRGRADEVTYTPDASGQGGAVVVHAGEVLAWVNEDGDAHLYASITPTTEAAPAALAAA